MKKRFGFLPGLLLFSVFVDAARAGRIIPSLATIAFVFAYLFAGRSASRWMQKVTNTFDESKSNRMDAIAFYIAVVVATVTVVTMVHAPKYLTIELECSFVVLVLARTATFLLTRELQGHRDERSGRLARSQSLANETDAARRESAFRVPLRFVVAPAAALIEPPRSLHEVIIASSVWRRCAPPSRLSL